MGYRYAWRALPKLPSLQSPLASESFLPPPVVIVADLVFPLYGGLPLCAEGAIVAGLGALLGSTRRNRR